MADKYISSQSQDIAHCPSCRGVLFKDFKSEGAIQLVSFLIRCPHCQNSVGIIINRDGIIIREPLGS